MRFSRLVSFAQQALTCDLVLFRAGQLQIVVQSLVSWQVPLHSTMCRFIARPTRICIVYPGPGHTLIDFRLTSTRLVFAGPASSCPYWFLSRPWSNRQVHEYVSTPSRRSTWLRSHSRASTRTAELRQQNPQLTSH